MKDINRAQLVEYLRGAALQLLGEAITASVDVEPKQVAIVRNRSMAVAYAYLDLAEVLAKGGTPTFGIEHSVRARAR